MIWSITTAGSDRAGICYEQRTYLTGILNTTLRRGLRAETIQGRKRAERMRQFMQANPEVPRAAVAKKFGVKKIFTDYHAMLADPELESVSITTMWDQHAAPAVAALQAGGLLADRSPAPPAGAKPPEY